MAAIQDAEIRKAIRLITQGNKRRVTLSDGNGRGGGRLSLMIRPAKSGFLAEWYATQHTHGKKRLRKIGVYPQLTLATARDQFAVYSLQIRQGGSIKHARGGSDSFESMLTAYCVNLTNLVTQTDRRRLFLTGNDAITAHIGGKRRAADITTAEISNWLRKFYERGSKAAANENRKHIRAAFSWALGATHDYKQAGSNGWGLTVNPAAAIPSDPGATQAGQRFLSPAEFGAFIPWLKLQDGDQFRAVEAIAMTGQRVNEIAMLKRENLADGGIYWSNTKAGKKSGAIDRPHFIPLPGSVAVSLAAQAASRRTYIFTVRGRDTLRDVCTTFAEAAGIPRFTTRDLRRTWKTLAGLAGISKDDRDRYQNHASQDVSSRHYDRYEYLTEKKNAALLWAAWVDGLLSV